MAEAIKAVGTKDIAGLAAAALLFLATFVQISPIKINPWSWLAKKIGKAVNGEVIEKVDMLDKEVKSQRAEFTEQNIINCRIRILRFGDEIMHETKHSKDHFDQTINDIDRYEKYCDEHPNFRNGITMATIERIRTVYNKRCHKNDFL